MYRLMIWTTLLLLTACASTPVSQTAICDGTAASRKALAAALIEDGGARSQRAGLRLLDQLEAGCHP
ncbi:hypothetical protein [Paracoccus denitrificans]|jgi:major membrane immunogen (membrane-anchored lipoprotein)|uniref:hypothetical protein n=1 Tax=Paracoccus denitrificans TaxID=266 RepID=UPI0002F94869|nr:hypothetical protein [Paracoccus denitrificans]MBB4625934.1 major membrane immunogen (membrane-anchored lipoprotein) [Paracoccus denitrificans]MCU7426904.1 hypothetical protein [Paracoccus denitrificans]QAR28726.1 hypothetical protein EO213_20815 [Paracoccus denitrificans]UPV96871.1 hypothetical protein M0K93_20900 [Paracoccus denitrificans]WQO36400.1 hypothetical protein U0005_18195 [Paracoccus denitrificans]